MFLLNTFSIALQSNNYTQIIVSKFDLKIVLFLIRKPLKPKQVTILNESWV